MTIGLLPQVVGEILSRFSEVAAADPEHAWFPARRTVDEIVTVAPDNRMVSGPFCESPPQHTHTHTTAAAAPPPPPPTVSPLTEYSM